MSDEAVYRIAREKMMNASDPEGRNPAEASDELLKLLRSLNERFGSAKDESIKPPFRWYESTHRGSWWIGHYVRLPGSDEECAAELSREMEYDQSSHSPSSMDIVSEKMLSWQDKMKDVTNWGYQYDSPFRRWALKSEHETMAKNLANVAGEFWTIPRDGRIDLVFSPEGLGISPDGPIAGSSDVLPVLDLLANTVACIRICDVDPWTDSILDYGKKNEKTDIVISHERRERLPLGEIIIPTERRFATLPIFQPIIMENFERQNEEKEEEDLIAFMGTEQKLPTWRMTGERPSRTFSGISNTQDRALWRRIIMFEGLSKTPAFLQDDAPSTSVLTHSRDFDITVSSIMAHQTLIFFTMIDPEEVLGVSQWKVGELYDDEKNESMSRQGITWSAFSVYVASRNIQYDPSQLVTGLLDPFYTILLLVPPRCALPRRTDVTLGLYSQDLAYPIAQNTRVEAELFCISYGLSTAVTQWTTLDDYLENLLVENFMDVKEYSKLLFDDEKFTKSRKYFWIIGCLGEFIPSIGDNIKQWDLYYVARIKPLLDKDNLADLLDAACLRKDLEISAQENGNRRLEEFKALVDEAQNCRETLVNLQTEFKTKLETVKALRDGLFNASALVESRTSSRLGENVRLLTYISIFYLPLTFCASLWTVPNIEDKAIKTPFVITSILVGVVTFAVVFNMEHVTQRIRDSYSRKRKVVLGDMERDQGFWGGKRKGFDSFKPPEEELVSTEWWIPLYAIRLVFRKDFWKRPSDFTNGPQDVPRTGAPQALSPGRDQTPQKPRVQAFDFWYIFSCFWPSRNKTESVLV